MCQLIHPANPGPTAAIAATTIIAPSLRYRLLKRLLDLGISAPFLLFALPGLLYVCYLHRRLPGLILGRACLGQHASIRYQYFIAANNQASARQLRILRLCGGAVALRLLPVLRGDMSLLGPDPRAPQEFANLPAALAQTRLKPGLIGVCHAGGQPALCNDLLVLAGTVLLWLHARLTATAPHGTRYEMLAVLDLIRLSMSQAVAQTGAALQQKLPTTITLLDPGSATLAAGNRSYQASLRRMNWVAANGIALRLACCLLPRRLAPAVRGIAFLPALCRQLRAHRYSVFVLAASQDLAAQTSIWMMRHYPQLRLAGFHGKDRDRTKDLQIAAEICAARTDVLLVAMPEGQAEDWLQQHLAASGATVGISVGTALDFCLQAGRPPAAAAAVHASPEQRPRRKRFAQLLPTLLFLLRVLAEKCLQARATVTPCASLPPGEQHEIANHSVKQQ